MTEPRTAAPQGAAPTLVLRPKTGWQPLDVKDLWRYRDLMWFLGMRDIRVRYKQTALGAAWAIIQPTANMLVFTVFFGRLGGMERRIEGGVPYALYTFVALLPWQLFASSLTQAGNSLVANQSLISKVYFPRLIVPLASMASCLLDFLVASLVLVGLMAWYGAVPGIAVLTLPLFVLLAVAAALAASLWLSALNVEYRDVRYAIPFLVQFWMFVSPVAYPSSIVPERWRALYGLNPIAGVVDGFRWALLSQGEPPGLPLLGSVAVTAVLLVGGLYYFRRMERTFADLV